MQTFIDISSTKDLTQEDKKLIKDFLDRAIKRDIDLEEKTMKLVSAKNGKFEFKNVKGEKKDGKILL